MKTPADLTVMIVDDNDYARAIAETSLIKLGVGQVIEVGDAVAGLEYLAQLQVDVVLLDWYMPEISGAGFVRLMRAGHHDPAIVVTTAYATKQNIGRMRELGLDHVLIKPFEQIQLFKSIGAALSDASGQENQQDAAFPARHHAV